MPSDAGDVVGDAEGVPGDGVMPWPLFSVWLSSLLLLSSFCLTGLRESWILRSRAARSDFPILALVLFPLLLTARPDVISQSSGRIVFFVLNCLVSPSTVIRAIMVTVPSFFGSFFFK